MIAMVVRLCNWTQKKEHAPKRWREGVVVNYSRKETRLAWATTEGERY